jgi:hypothetical protein
MSKDRKPAKPLSKKTLTLIEQLQRRRGVRDLAKRFLIVCEDHKSAPNYFRALKKHLNLSGGSVRIAGSEGNTQPIQVVNCAVELKREAARPHSGTEPFAQVWCAIDGDYGDEIHNARLKADKHGIKLAISTMCFEYWILLHFEANDRSTMSCDGLVQTLRRKHLPKYEKGKCDFDAVVRFVDEACRRAEKLRKPGIDRGHRPEDQNPCSEVYRLVDAIREVCKENPPGGTGLRSGVQGGDRAGRT